MPTTFRSSTVSLTASLFLLCVLSTYSANAQSRTVPAGAIVGCYDLTVGKWEGSVTDPGPYHAIPTSIRIDTVGPSNGYGQGLTPDIAWPHGHAMRGTPRWGIRGDTVSLLWSNGFSPTSARLTVVGDSLIGEAEARNDEIPPGKPNWPHAHVVARRIPCPGS
ncbi:MAG TPA: hypothetical protein VE110_02230 [Gemmatimonadaceae bacterium]|nr:hypothetical protein [Gemmatimonadaceae bacterium]